MKYIVKVKGARIFLANKQGVLTVTSSHIPQGAIVEGSFKKMSVVTPKGTMGVLFFEIPSLLKGNRYIHSNLVIPYKSKVEGEEMSDFSGAEVAAKVGGINTLATAGIFGGLGFLLGTLIGENKVQLTISGAVLGGLIGYNSAGSEEKLMASGGNCYCKDGSVQPKCCHSTSGTSNLFSGADGKGKTIRRRIITATGRCGCDHKTCPDGYCDGCWCVEKGYSSGVDGRKVVTPIISPTKPFPKSSSKSPYCQAYEDWECYNETKQSALCQGLGYKCATSSSK